MTAVGISSKFEYGFICVYPLQAISRAENKCILVAKVTSIHLLFVFALQEPLTKRFAKTLGMGCCTSAPINIEIQINKTGFVPGEYVVINGSIENGT